MVDQNLKPASAQALRALLHWYQDMGVDDLTGNTPANFFTDFKVKSSPSVSKSPALHKPQQHSVQFNSKATNTPRHPSTKPTTDILRPDANALSPQEAIDTAKQIAASSKDLPALEEALKAFDGCPLKKGARNTVFADGTPKAPLLVIGEAPGRDEDREGRPFVGRAGHLLDKMLNAIDHDRHQNAFISNAIFWRPPGNRTPTQEEMMICQPFVGRLIELSAPKVILIAGGAPLKALLNKTGIMKTRGKWQQFTTTTGTSVPVMPTFHPAYLLRNPSAKRLVWQDLQALAQKLRE